MIYRNAMLSDIDELLVLMGEYYVYDDLQFDAEVMRARLREFLQDSRWGEIWMIGLDGKTIGYTILSVGFGLEHGRNVLIDELYLREPFRHGGLGSRIVAHVEETYRKQGFSSLHADVETSNAKAQRFWASRGFEKYNRNPHIKMI